MIDVNILNILLNAAEIQKQDCILEVGPGLGVLTEPLRQQCRQVIAVEKDKRLAGYLAEKLAGANLTLITSDILDCVLNQPPLSEANKVVANLPYAVASRFLMELFLQDTPPERIVVTIQHEVAERLAAAPRCKDYGLLTVMAQAIYQVEVVKKIAPSCFFPPPQVTSAIVLLKRHADYPLHRRSLLELVKQAFSRRRKKIGSLLIQMEPFSGMTDEERLRQTHVWGVSLDQRPEELTPGQWMAIVHFFCTSPHGFAKAADGSRQHQHPQYTQD